MGTVFEVRQAIQEIQTDEGKKYMNILIGSHGDKDKAYSDARKSSKASRLPIFVVRVQKDTMACFDKGKEIDKG